MILVGVALFVLLNGVLEILTQNPLMKIPQGLTMKIWERRIHISSISIIGININITIVP